MNGTTLHGSFYNVAICCKWYIFIRRHNKQPYKLPDQNEGEIWSCTINMAEDVDGFN